MKKTPPITSLDTFPAVLTVDEIAAIFRIGVQRIRRDVRAGRFHVRPARTRPLVWLKSDVETFLHAGTDETNPCPRYRPDRNGECLDCDEPAYGHSAAALRRDPGEAE